MERDVPVDTVVIAAQITFRDGLTPQVVQLLLTDSSWLTAPFGMTWSSELPHPRSSNNWSIADFYRM